MRAMLTIRYLPAFLISICILSMIFILFPSIASPGTRVPIEGIRTTLTATITPTKGTSDSDYSTLLAEAQTKGSLRVIVGLKMSFQPEGHLANAQAVQNQRTTIRQLRGQLVASLAQAKAVVLSTDWVIPYIALDVDVAALRLLIASPLVSSISKEAQGTLHIGTIK
jgi:hypothetical protein